jgi:hypothetical protein
MIVDIDETGRDDATGNVDDLIGRRAVEAVNGGNPIPLHGYVRPPTRCPRAIDDRAVAEQEGVVHGWRGETEWSGG